MIQKALDWLAEQPEDAAELAELLAETVPRLGLNTQKSRMPGISRAATSKQSLQLLHADMSLMQRLQAARPMLVGAGHLVTDTQSVCNGCILCRVKCILLLSSCSPSWALVSCQG